MMHLRPALGALLLVLAGTAVAAEVDPLLKEGKSWLVAQQSSQKTIDKIEEDRQKMEAEYRILLREIEGLDAYNRQLDRQIGRQVDELAELDQSIAQATTVDRQVLPLMDRMVGALEQFIALDLPFLEDERAERLQFVKDAMERVDVSVAEKFRQVLEAYNVELEFGRTIEAYTDVQQLEGETQEVDILRIGRIGLFYQSLDGSQSGRWNAETESWEPVGAGYRNSIRSALKVARKLAAPDLLTLPLSTAENAK